MKITIEIEVNASLASMECLGTPYDITYWEFGI